MEALRRFWSAWEARVSLDAGSLDSCRANQLDYYSASIMRNLAITVVLTALTIVALSGCAAPAPSPEQQTRQADQQRDAEHQQAEFRKGLPPVSNPGQGW
jgi:hypothetical protein